LPDEFLTKKCVCSAGVGRTGTYIALDMMLQQMKTAKQQKQTVQVDVFQTAKRMREDRVIMIQTVVSPAAFRYYWHIY
jgi:protein tyrosine phosphatase